MNCFACTNNAGNAAGSVLAACNVNLLPITRRQCVQCEGTLDSVCAATQIGASRPCLAPSERCFTRRSDRLVMRGCQAQHRGLCDDQQQCLFCNTDNCNVLSHNSTDIPQASGAQAGASLAPMLVIGGALVLMLKGVVA